MQQNLSYRSAPRITMSRLARWWINRSIDKNIGDSPAGKLDWKLTDSDWPDCVPKDKDVAIKETETGIRFVCTPEERFKNLAGFTFGPHYALIDGLRMHYVDEGPREGEVILMLHGQPTWSYLYRKMIPPLAAEGYRTIAVDHIGMGRSDKPIDLSFHTYELHVQRLKKFISALNLKDISLFCHDWGGLMGLQIVGEQPDLFARVVAANTTLPVIPKGMNPFRVPNPVKVNCGLGGFDKPKEHALARPTFIPNFQKWILYALTAPNFRPSQVVNAMAVNELTIEEAAAYDAPYPSMVYKAAVRAFPSMIAAVEDQNSSSWKSLGKFKKPFLFLAGKQDDNQGSEANQKRLTGHIPGAKGQLHERFDAGHFIQEDIGETLAAKMIRFLNDNPLP
jgi:pimeloyl-ACP methyl ester carboxylesterase